MSNSLWVPSAFCFLLERTGEGFGVLGESMEEFLAQPDVDFDLLDPSMTDAMSSWPNLSLWTA